MKTITNIIIINSQNVESEYLLAVIITSVSKKKALSPSGISSSIYAYSYKGILSKSIPLAAYA